MEETFTLSFYVPGTLGANWGIRWQVPFDCQMVHVSAVGSNTRAAGLTLGHSADADAYLVKSAIGVSGTPVEFDLNDFVGGAEGRYPRLTRGTVLVLDLDYDYNGGGSASASADVAIVATFVKG